MSKKLQEMIRENQKRNNINIKMFAVKSKSTEETENKNNKKENTKMKTNKNRKFKSTINMALSAGKQTIEGGSFKMYVGLTPVGCKYVNPTKEQLTQILGREWTKDMVYTKTDDQGTKQVNLMFPMEIHNVVNGEEVNLIVLQTIALWDASRLKSDGSKFQVVDKWGNFSWVTEEQFNNHITPLSSTGKKLMIDASTWRKAYRGEENLMKFLKPRLNIPNAFEYKNNEWVLKTDTTGCECRLDEISKYFDGNVSEIQAGLNMMPENQVKGFLYVDEYEGKQRQAIAREYVNLASNKYTDIEKEIENINNNKGTNFTLCELQEYKVESSSFTQSTAQMPVTENPFENANSPWNN